ncbi:MAG TPA: hypothetical protein DFJ59_09660 [Alphaproteobacteria bacterium]|nr:hypothetical protein [Alphaproteobacteria bacterium]|tara:strand:+ start:129 stop:716 length:588 start_codon:yes stop_codon:yes gene_type:complete
MTMAVSQFFIPALKGVAATFAGILLLANSSSAETQLSLFDLLKPGLLEAEGERTPLDPGYSAPYEKFSFHALVGTWWAKTVYDTAGTALWHGGEDGDRLVMRVGPFGKISTTHECNILQGNFGPAEEGAVALVSPYMSMTRMACWDDYPPSVSFERIARFEREGLELRFFDKDGLPIATYYNAHALKAALVDILQ